MSFHSFESSCGKYEPVPLNHKFGRAAEKIRSTVISVDITPFDHLCELLYLLQLTVTFDTVSFVIFVTVAFVAFVTFALVT